MGVSNRRKIAATIQHTLGRITVQNSRGNTLAKFGKSGNRYLVGGAMGIEPRKLLALIAVGLVMLVVASIVLWSGVGTESESPKPQPEPVVAERPTPRVRFDIQGARIGDKLEPLWAFSRMDSKEAFNPEAQGNETIEVDGDQIHVHYQFADSKLVEVSVEFDPEAFDRLLKAYTMKFEAAPHELKGELKRTGLGVEVENVIAVWETYDGPFVLEKYGETIDTGRGRIFTDAAKQFHAKKDMEAELRLRSKL